MMGKLVNLAIATPTTQPALAFERHYMPEDARALYRYNAACKSEWAAYVWLFLLGGFGAHRFYLEDSGSAAAFAMLTLAAILLAGVGSAPLAPLALFAVAGCLMADALLIPGLVRKYNETLLTRLA